MGMHWTLIGHSLNAMLTHTTRATLDRDNQGNPGVDYKGNP